MVESRTVLCLMCLYTADNASAAVWLAATSVHSVQGWGRSWLWRHCKVLFLFVLFFITLHFLSVFVMAHVLMGAQRHIIEVTLRQAKLILGWVPVTIRRYPILVFNQPPRHIKPGHPSAARCSEYWEWPQSPLGKKWQVLHNSRP